MHLELIAKGNIYSEAGFKLFSPFFQAPVEEVVNQMVKMIKALEEYKAALEALESEVKVTNGWVHKPNLTLATFYSRLLTIKIIRPS